MLPAAPPRNLDHQLQTEPRAEIPCIFEAPGAIFGNVTTEPGEALLPGGKAAALWEGRATRFGVAPEACRRQVVVVTPRIFGDAPMDFGARMKGAARVSFGGSVAVAAEGPFAVVPDGCRAAGFRANRLARDAVAGQALHFACTLGVSEITGSGTVPDVEREADSWVGLVEGVQVRLDAPGAPVARLATDPPSGEMIECAALIAVWTNRARRAHDRRRGPGAPPLRRKGLDVTYILAIDQGTTSSRAIVFDVGLRPVAVAQEEFPQHYPRPGWVEHDPSDLWSTVAGTARAAVERAGIDAGAIAAIGIANQRETVVIWDRATGQPIHNAVVWQDRRTADLCAALQADGHTAMVTERTGLLLDPYFSATKVRWLLDTVPGARERAARGELALGTIDTFLIWMLTGGRVHATDATNAARTMLFDIGRGTWDADLCRLFGVPMSMLPEVRDCADQFGTTRPDLFGRAIPILGVAGDQQAATIGQACFAPGMMKCTYGTGCFALLNTGADRVPSANRLLTTIAYQFGGKRTYALEGSIFIAGAVVQWLRDGLKIIRAAGETQGLAETADPEQDLVLVPAFTGLGAPYWRPDCRGAVFGLTRNSGPAELARAALESVGYQTRDLLEAMRADWGAAARGVLRVDGGMAASAWTMQFLADILGAPVDRPRITETTALGAAWLAAWKAGVAGGPEVFAQDWARDRRFEPAMPAADRDARYARWRRAVAAVMSL